MLLIERLLLSITSDMDNNIKLILNEFKKLNYTDKNGDSLLHIFVNGKYCEGKVLLAIKSLLRAGIDPNTKGKNGYNFIQLALRNEYSEGFILNIINEALKYSLDVNHKDYFDESMVFAAIESDKYVGKLENIYELLCDNGYDSTMVSSEGKNLIEAMNSKKYSQFQIKKFGYKIYEKTGLNLTNDKYIQEMANGDIEIKSKSYMPSLYMIPEEDVLELEKYGEILTTNDYLVSPTIGREKELKNLILALALDKKRPLIVGRSGVGKTALVDELSYRITIGEVPTFLQNKIIWELNPDRVIAGTQYRGLFEENMVKIMTLCNKYDIIVFIDEMHRLYGIGTSKDNANDMASMLKYYIDRTSMKVIGTTTEDKYSQYFAVDDFKRRFVKVTVLEPEDDVLYQIVSKVIDDYLLKNNISFENEELKKQIITIIIDSTKKNNRVYNDMINNPDLAISIVDWAFAIAKTEDSPVMTYNHFIESFKLCDKIYDSVKNTAISRIKNIDGWIYRPLVKTLSNKTRNK